MGKTKKQREVRRSACIDHPYRRPNGHRYLIDDDNAWADLILSKTALILATVIILTAVYALATSSSEIIEKDELEVLTMDIASSIDSVGSVRSGTGNVTRTYTFDTHNELIIDYKRLNISVSGEYVTAGFDDNGNTVRAARALSYRTLPFSNVELRGLLKDRFAAEGTENQPINSAYPFTDVTEFLSIEAADAIHLNTSMDVLIEKVSVFVTGGSEVKELEYILVHQ
ncbi:hypothetical protein [Methanolobus sp. WCC4]|uniref:hypothetical protein n=1 Tax=Methanolobus sp. WCC4 TaxID=3125784 RepID=UPI0030F8D6BC